MAVMSRVRRCFRAVFFTLFAGFILFVSYHAYQFYHQYVHEKEILRQVISRLEADSRIAEVLVTEVKFSPITQKHMTTIKFLEYDTLGEPLVPRYFTFAGNIIQFQSLVVRFEDIHIRNGDALRGRSAYLFWKVFMLDGPKTQEYDITPVNDVPAGYKINAPRNAFEDKIWQQFWDYALDGKKAKIQGIKNAQIEAPGTKFVPGMLYTLKIEHDGGIRIDAAQIPAILKGEKI
jgi:hypothetical protein